MEGVQAPGLVAMPNNMNVLQGGLAVIFSVSWDFETYFN
jgi:hypothetical protein